ncbi:MAG: TolC family protein [Bacteroidales bacterium]|nr:TolC family protein [Bacteroidales bacterium]
MKTNLDKRYELQGKPRTLFLPRGTEIFPKAIKNILTLFFLLGMVNALYCQQQDSLVQYLSIAAKNNPVVMQKWYNYQASLQKLPQSASLPDPQLDLGVFLSPMELSGGNQVADIKLMQMFPWFGVLKNAKDEMSLMAKAQYETFRDSKLQVYFDIKSAWYELYKLDQNIRISERNRELLRSLERLALIRFKTGPTGGVSSPSGANMSEKAPVPSSGSSGMQGMGGNQIGSRVSAGPSVAVQGMGASTSGSGLTDIYRIQIEISDLENNIALLINQLKTLKARFNSYLNRPLSSPVSLPDTLLSEKPGLALTSISDSMPGNNPMLDMIKYEQQSIEAKKRMVTRMGYPMVGLGVNYSLINKNPMSDSPMNGQDMVMPMVTLSLPIYRKKYKAMQTEANLMKSATEQEYQALSNSLQADYYEAVQWYLDAERRIKLYENQLLLTKKSLDITVKSFSASGSGLSDILRLRQQTYDYEFRQIGAIVDYNTAIARLERITNYSQNQ